jgi:hypothetical protein
MRTSSIVGCAALALALMSERPAAAQGKAQPPELLLSVGIGPDSTLDSLRAYMNSLRPGTGALVTPMLRQQIAGMVSATSLDGLDERGTLYVLAVDGGPALKGQVVVGRIADDVKLGKSVAPAHLIKKNAWAVIGPKAVAEKIAPFALATFAGQTISGPPIATIYTANLMARYRTELQDARKKLSSGLGAAGGQMTAMMESYFDGMMSALADSERLIVSFDITKDVAAIDLALAPRPGTRLARLVGLQQPADYALVGKLPAAPAPVLVAGRLDAGPYRAGMIEAMVQLYGPGAPASMAAALGAMFQVATGDFAMILQMAGGKGMEMSQLFGVTDTKGAERAIGQVLDSFKRPQVTTQMGMTITYQASPAAAAHDGVALRGIDASYDLSKATPDARAMVEKMVPNKTIATRIGVFDKLGAVSTGGDGVAGTAAVIDAARGKARRFAPPAQVGDFLAGSRARKESLAMVIDLGGISGAAAAAGHLVMASIGFADQRAHLRLTLPAATFRGLTGGP